MAEEDVISEKNSNEFSENESVDLSEMDSD